MKKRIFVTRKVIQEAIARRDENISICKRCIITIALQKAFKTEQVITYISVATVKKINIKLPLKVIELTIKASRYWEQVKPFSFTIAAPRSATTKATLRRSKSVS